MYRKICNIQIKGGNPEMRKRFIVTTMAAIMTMATIAGCGASASAGSNSNDAGIVAAANEETVDIVDLVGGWSTTDSTEITDDVRAVFDKATQGLTGVDYEPVAYLGSQIVAGKNHAILCRATVVVPNAKPYYTIMYIYEDLQGNATIQDFSDIKLGYN
jgi:hypothetical protein